jgi:hypothetical protein
VKKSSKDEEIISLDSDDGEEKNSAEVSGHHALVFSVSEEPRATLSNVF